MRGSRHTLPLALALLTTLPSCWVGPVDDAGDDAFVAESVLNVLGRRIRPDERAFLLTLLQQEGRHAVVDVLLEQPEFTDHWTRVLMDDLIISAGTGDPTSSRAVCMTEERLPASLDAGLVAHLLSASAHQPFCPTTGPGTVDGGTRNSGALPGLETPDPGAYQAEVDAVGQTTPRLVPAAVDPIGVDSPIGWGAVAQVAGELPASGVYAPLPAECEDFTMADVFRATLEADRLDALYRAAIVPVAVFEPRDDRGAERFLDGHLGRNTGCMGCHTTTYSTTDGVKRNQQWDRFWPANRLDLEGTTFSWNANDNDQTFHYGGNGGDAAFAGVEAFFGDNAVTVHPAEAVRPWGIAGECVERSENGTPTVGLRVQGNADAHIAGIQGSPSILDLIDGFGTGATLLDVDDLPNLPAPAPQGISLMTDQEFDSALASNGCNACHNANSANAPTDLREHTRRMPYERIYTILTQGSMAGDMPKEVVFPNGGQTAEEMAFYLAYRAGHVQPSFHTDPRSGLAHLTAMHVVDNVYEELTGARLTLDHGFPRTEEAQWTLNVLTREFTDSGWSLKRLIKRIQLSEGANRTAPALSAEAAYPLGMVVQPWAAVEPGVVPDPHHGDNKNGQGDIAHRWSSRSLVHQAGRSLKWVPESGYPGIQDSTSVDPLEHWPTWEDAVGLGATQSLREQGHSDPGLGTQLAWEQAVDGCHPFAADDTVDDFVDLYLDEVVAGSEPTVELALLDVKNRIVSTDLWWTGERALVANLAPGIDLDDPIDPIDPDHEGLLRDYCTALLRSPQFMLYGLPVTERPLPPGYAPPADEPDYCDTYAMSAYELGYDWITCTSGGAGGVTTGR